MSQIQNTTLHNFIQPALFLSVAFLAGSESCASFFPASSRGSLLLTSGLAVSISLVSQKWADAEESASSSFLRTTGSIALGTLGSICIAKGLKDRISLHPIAAVRFSLLEVLLAAVLAGISSMITSFEMKSKHAEYLRNPQAWQALSIEERTAYVRTFYKNHFPPLSLEQAPIDTKIFTEIREFSQLSINQLHWHTAIKLEHYDLEQLFALNHSLHSYAQPLAFNNILLSDAVIDFVRDNPRYIDLLYIYYTHYPFLFALQKNQLAENGIEFVGKPSLPTPEEWFSSLSRNALDHLNKETLEKLYAAFQRTEALQTLSTEKQLEFNVRARQKEVKQIKLDFASKDTQNQIIRRPLFYDWFAREFSTSKLFLGTLDDDFIQKLNTKYFLTSQILLNGQKIIFTTPFGEANIFTTPGLGVKYQELAYHDMVYLQENPNLWPSTFGCDLLLFNERALELSLPTCLAWPIKSEIQIELIKLRPSYITMIHQQFTRHSPLYESMESELKVLLSSIFKENNLSEIEDTRTLLTRISAQRIKSDYAGPHAWEWHLYFDSHQDVWNVLPQDKKDAFEGLFNNYPNQCPPFLDTYSH